MIAAAAAPSGAGDRLTYVCADLRDWQADSAVKGTALRPALTALAHEAAATEAFLAECGTALRKAYPASAAGTVFPFRRTFAVGHRAAA
jgi:hypothetical protein